MEPFETLDTTTLLAGRSDWMDSEAKQLLSAYPLESIETEFPHHARVLESADGPPRPREEHPLFFGCFDWHSAVHSHWCLLRQLRLFDDHPDESAIVETLSTGFTEDNVAGELDYFEDNETFEKPYGWAWFLQMMAELELWNDDRAEEWRTTLRPLETRIAELVESEFLTQERPFRVGTHHNSAFALGCILDYARVVDDESLEAATVETARAFYADDTDYPLEYEPLSWDFLSPGLAEADLMRRVLDGDAFADWLNEFMPAVAPPEPTVALDPVDVEPNPDEGLALHFVGLNLTRAWSLAGIAETLDDHPAVPAFERSAREHAEVGLHASMTDDYAGSHWLSSFVLYLLTRNDGGIAP